MIGRTYCGTVSFDVVLRVTYYAAYIAFALHNGCSCIDTAGCLLSGTLHCLLYYNLYLCCNVDLYSQMTAQEKMKKRMQMMLNKQCKAL